MVMMGISRRGIAAECYFGTPLSRWWRVHLDPTRAVGADSQIP
jgi:hypothetical protein